MDIFSLIHDDHQKAKQLFSTLRSSAAADRASRQKEFTKLQRELIAHSKAEEDVFYPQLKELDEEQFKDAIQEHREIERSLTQLSRMDCMADDWLDRLGDLEQLVNHHVREEEGKVFKTARPSIDGEKAEKMGKKMKKDEDQRRGAA